MHIPRDQWLNPVTQFEELYLIEFPKLKHKIWVIVHDDEVANDLAQDAFIKAFKARFTYIPLSPPGAWLFRIGRNLALDYLRRKAVIEKHNNTIDKVSSDSDANVVETKIILAKAYRGLSKREKKVIALFYFCGNNDRTIAGKLNISQLAVGRARRKALVILHANLTS